MFSVYMLVTEYAVVSDTLSRWRTRMCGIVLFLMSIRGRLMTGV